MKKVIEVLEKDWTTPAVNYFARFGELCAKVIAAPFVWSNKLLMKVL